MSEKQIVYTPSLFEVDKSFDDQRFMRVRINAMTTGINRNNSRFSLDCVKAAKDSFANIPILAHVIKTTDKDGNEVLDYGSHDAHVEDDAFNEDEARMIYEEQVVGIVPETNDFEIIENKETGEYEVFVTALLYRDYGNYACDILESRGGKTDVSMEILCDELSYSAADKCLDVGKMIAAGITLLGDAVTPAMPGAHAEMFSIQENDRQDQLIRIMQELKESLDNYTQAVSSAQNLGKEEDQVDEVKIEEMNTEEETNIDESTQEEAVVEEAESAEVSPSEEESEETAEVKEGESVEDDETEIETEEVEESEEDESKNEFSITVNDVTRTFSISMQEEIAALETLCNDVYSETDNDYYMVTVYGEEKSVVMSGLFSGRNYKQNYKVRKGQYQLVGERIQVKPVFVTADEEAELDKMRSNYAAIESELNLYKEEPEKISIIESEDYSQIKETTEYAELAKRDTYFSMAKEEISKKLDDILLSYAKQKKIEFAVVSDDKKEINVKKLPVNLPKPRGRYGGLGKTKEE